MANDEFPPSLPYRCGTMMLQMTPEQLAKNAEYTREKEQDYIDWVHAHPSPRQEWLDTVEILDKRRALMKAVNDPNTAIGRACLAVASSPPDKPCAQIIVLADVRAKKEEAD